MSGARGESRTRNVTQKSRTGPSSWGRHEGYETDESAAERTYAPATVSQAVRPPSRGDWSGCKDVEEGLWWGMEVSETKVAVLVLEEGGGMQGAGTVKERNI